MELSYGRSLFDAQKDEGPRSRLLEQDAMEGLLKPFSDAALLGTFNPSLRVN